MSQLILRDVIPHRQNITAPDTVLPTTGDQGVGMNYSEEALVYVGSATSSGAPTGVITPYWYTEFQGGEPGQWFADVAQQINVAVIGNAVYLLKAKGAFLYLNVDSLTGTGADVSVWIGTKRFTLR